MPSSFVIVDPAHAESAYRVGRDVEYPYAEFAGEQPIRLYRGDVHVERFESEPDVDWNPYNVIVDGDLTVDGDVRWHDHGSGNFLLVTGNLRCKNLILQGCPNVVVRGDLAAANGVQGSYGDDGGFLKVRGRTHARVIVNTLYFTMEFAEPPDAVVLGDAHRTSCPVDFDDDVDQVVEPDLLDEKGQADERKIGAALAEGRWILRPHARPAHLAALDFIEALLPRADEVREIDLAGKGLRRWPDALFRFRGLKKLTVRDNELLGAVPDRVAELADLEELDLASTGLTAWPAALARLPRLRVLDVSGNPFAALPDAVGDLAALRVLRAEGLGCAIPDAIGRLSSLEELHLGRLSGEDDPSGVARPATLPAGLFALSRLRVLDLAGSSLAEIPDHLLRLSSLEELYLDAALGGVPRLPELARLPRLRVLHVDGNTAFAGHHPERTVLEPVFRVATLEELRVDRWGEQEAYGRAAGTSVVVRPAWTALPDDAFARMPGLRVLDLSFNDFTTLPESFFALAHLENVDLRHTKLDRATLDRLRTTLPRVKMDLRGVKTRDDLDDPNWKRVHELVEGAAARASSDRAAAAAGFEEALALCTSGACFSEYDELYALYGAVDALGHLRADAEGGLRATYTRKIVEHATAALARVPRPDAIWHFTDEGAFQQEVTRRTGNWLAWVLLDEGEVERALDAVDRAIAFAEGREHDFVRDTKVRILLRAGRTHEAYALLDAVLARDPSFADVQDLAASAEYRAWRAANSAAGSAARG